MSIFNLHSASTPLSSPITVTSSRSFFIITDTEASLPTREALAAAITGPLPHQLENFCNYPLVRWVEREFSVEPEGGSAPGLAHGTAEPGACGSVTGGVSGHGGALHWWRGIRW